MAPVLAERRADAADEARRGLSCQENPRGFFEFARLFGMQPMAGIGYFRETGGGKQAADRRAVLGLHNDMKKMRILLMVKKTTFDFIQNNAAS